MKKVLSVILSISIFCMTIPVVKAVEDKIAYTTDFANIRVLASTNGAIIENVDPGVRLSILSTGATGNGCTKNWYQVRYYTSKTGYVCGDNITIYNMADFNKTEPTTEYEKTLKNAGFTDPTYWPYLTELHKQHPNWQFIAYIPNKPVTFDTVVKEESDALGKSLINLTTKRFEGWKNINSLNYLTNTFANNYPGGGANWYAAAPEVVAYYLDPRNFMNDQNIFMFEMLSYNEAYHTVEGLDNLLKGTWLEGKPTIVQEDIDSNLTYAEMFLKAGKETGMNPYFLASRVLQEIGRVRTTIATGTVPGFEGYFNFYNINASGAQDQIITNGLNHAVKKGWNSEYKAILGGAEFLKSSYIGYGQDNPYLQKWDIVGDEYYTFQYMQNIEAPAKESIAVYDSYQESSLLENAFVFKIPVYKSMPASTDLPNPASPNNWLKDVTIEGAFLENFNPEITDKYTYYVSAAARSITIYAAAISDQATITGVGDISLDNTTTNHVITVTSGNGKKREYKITIVKSEVIEATVDDIVDNLGVRSDGTYISGIGLGTNTQVLSKKIKEYSAKANAVIKDSNGTEKVDKIFGTGDTITITNGSGESKTFSIIIYGDLNGDGEITILDLLRVQKIILKSTNLAEVYQKAGDINRDGEVAILDLLRVQKHILGAYVIEQ